MIKEIWLVLEKASGLSELSKAHFSSLLSLNIHGDMFSLITTSTLHFQGEQITVTFHFQSAVIQRNISALPNPVLDLRDTRRCLSGSTPVPLDFSRIVILFHPEFTLALTETLKVICDLL